MFQLDRAMNCDMNSRCMLMISQVNADKYHVYLLPLICEHQFHHLQFNITDVKRLSTFGLTRVLGWTSPEQFSRMMMMVW
jgi:hypothetical protein